MARRRLEAEASRELLVETATRMLKERGANVTVAAVAEEAGCAKGLVNYHFKTKAKLWESVAVHLTETRSASWTEAFRLGDASAVVTRTWELLTNESTDGTTTAWLSLTGPQPPVPEQTVRHMVESFREVIGTSLSGLLDRCGIRLRIPTSELAELLASVIAGMGLRLLHASSPSEYENAYAATWLGILSLDA
jgi:AcrR family transcriptional regulator